MANTNLHPGVAGEGVKMKLKDAIGILYGTASRSLSPMAGSIDGQSFYAGPGGDADLEKDINKVEEAHTALLSFVGPFVTALERGREGLKDCLEDRNMVCQTKLWISDDSGINAWVIAELRKEFPHTDQYGLTKFLRHQ